jgi:hypothetical protein
MDFDLPLSKFKYYPGPILVEGFIQLKRDVFELK